MVTGQERALRRLRSLHEHANQQPVGVRCGNQEIVLFIGWDDRWGRLRCVSYRRPWIELSASRLVAQGLLGKDAVRAFELVEPPDHVWYVQPMDLGLLTAAGPRVSWPKLPPWVRWFDWRCLGYGLGQQDNGHVTWNGRMLVEVAGT
jgi:hypothetical protein